MFVAVDLVLLFNFGSIAARQNCFVNTYFYGTETCPIVMVVLDFNQI